MVLNFSGLQLLGVLNTMLKPILLVSVCLYLDPCEGHARLLDPPSRASLWRVRPQAPRNQDDAALSCGGFDVLFGQNRGRCGVCGDPFNLKAPRPNEFGGTFGKAGVVSTYRRGQKMSMMFEVVINHGGRVHFKLCPAPASGEVTQGCLDARPLSLVEGKKTKPFFAVNKVGKSRITLQLPKDLSCERCVLQYSYVGADRDGQCSDGKKRKGCGNQALYRACADIAIKGNRNKRQVCYGTGRHNGNTAMDSWCNSNCAIGYCPPSHCQCDGEEEEEEEEGGYNDINPEK